MKLLTIWIFLNFCHFECEGSQRGFLEHVWNEIKMLRCFLLSKNSSTLLQMPAGSLFLKANSVFCASQLGELKSQLSPNQDFANHSRTVANSKAGLNVSFFCTCPLSDATVDVKSNLARLLEIVNKENWKQALGIRGMGLKRLRWYNSAWKTWRA